MSTDAEILELVREGNRLLEKLVVALEEQNAELKAERAALRLQLGEREAIGTKPPAQDSESAAPPSQGETKEP